MRNKQRCPLLAKHFILENSQWEIVNCRYVCPTAVCWEDKNRIKMKLTVKEKKKLKEILTNTTASCPKCQLYPDYTPKVLETGQLKGGLEPYEDGYKCCFCGYTIYNQSELPKARRGK